MEKLQLQRKNRVDIGELQYQSKASIMMEEAGDTVASHYEQVKNEARSYMLDNYYRKRLLAEATINPKKKPEFDRMISNFLQEEKKVVPEMTHAEIVEKVWKDLCSLGPLEQVMQDDDYNEVMLNGYDEPWVEFKGEDIQAKDLIKFNDRKHYEDTIITKILNACGKSVSDRDPIVDARVGDARVSVVWNPISQMKGPIVTIRKFPPLNLTPEGFLGYGTSSEEMLIFMKLCVLGGCSIAMGGATGSGKTTTFKMMAGFIFKGQRTLVSEDTAEMKLDKLYPYSEGYHFVSEECRIQGDPELDITIQHLLEAAMRQRPERLIIGEVRRAPDLLTAIEAASTGHPVWYTMHMRSAGHGITRQKMMLRRADPSMGSENAEELLADSLDIIIMQKRYQSDRKRRISEIVEVTFDETTGKIILNPIFEWNVREKKFIRKNAITEKLIEVFENAEIPFEDYEQFTVPPVGSGEGNQSA